MNIRKLSELCGASVCTVSRVLSGRAGEFRITAATARKVLDAAAAAGYRPNYLSQSMNTGRTHTLGVVFANTVDLFLGNILEGVEAVLRGTPFRPLVETCENSLALQDEAIRQMQYREVDGILLYPQALPPGSAYRLPEPRHRRKSFIPVVLIGRELAGWSHDQVMMEDAAAGRQVAEEFLAAGCRRFAVVTLFSDCSSNQSRERGFMETLRKHRVPEACRRLIRPDAPEPGDAEFLARADALFGINTGLLTAVLTGLRRTRDLRELRLASIGRFEAEPLLDLNWRTLPVPGRRLGEEGARTLLWRLDAPGRPARQLRVPLA